MMKKSVFKKLPEGSPEYVIAHAHWRASRGKRPSASLTRTRVTDSQKKTSNPRLALHRSRILREKVWKLRGCDQFDGGRYPLPGNFLDKDSAIRAAKKRCRHIERMQPSEHSGGRKGIQDLTFVVSPQGREIEVTLQS